MFKLGAVFGTHLGKFYSTTWRSRVTTKPAGSPVRLIQSTIFSLLPISSVNIIST